MQLLKKALDIVTPRELRSMFAKSAARSWHRIMADAHGMRLPLAQNSLGHFGVIRKKITQFKAARLENFQKHL